MAEDKTHNWTTEETEALIHWRTDNEFLFTGKRNSSISGFEDFVVTSGFRMTAKQAKKKWNNLKAKYKELKDLSTIKGVEAGGVSTASWQWFGVMDAALQRQRTISPSLAAAAGDLTPTAACSPSGLDGATAGRPRRKRARDSGAIIQFLKEQADRERERQEERVRERETLSRAEGRARDGDAIVRFLKEQVERERQALAREEERERAAEARAERFLSLLEKLVNKF